MARSPLFGRRIHISGSISKCPSVATPENVKTVRDLVKSLVEELVKAGANFVVPVDDDKSRKSDNLPITFDWLVWETIHGNLQSRPPDLPDPVAIAVIHHKTGSQIPEKYTEIWQEFINSSLVHIEDAAHWNMGSKRMELQAKHGDILIALGGSDGVKYLADLYHDSGKPVIPLNLPICRDGQGARHLFERGKSTHQPRSLFRLSGSESSQSRLNKLDFLRDKSISDMVNGIVKLMEDLERPTAFAVRLLNEDTCCYVDVDNFFTEVVQPVIEAELGYKLMTIDNGHTHEHSWVNQEIFERLHRCSLVIADLTCARPNCYMELGYALGRDKRFMVTARRGERLQFDTSTLSCHFWVPDDNLKDAQRSLLQHWQSVSQRPPLVHTRTLSP